MNWCWKLFQGNSDIMIDSCTYIYIYTSLYLVVHITRKCWSPKFCGSYAPLNLKFPKIYFWSSLWHNSTPTKFRGSTFPGNMHNYIWCTYYLPSFMKFCSVVSDGQDKNNMSPHKSVWGRRRNYWTEFHETW
jgi:hypothetical protein